MIIHHGDNPLTFSFDIGHPFVVGDIRTDGITDPLRSGGVPPLVNNIIKFVKQVTGK
jgi:hypothetical protein